MPTEAIAVDLRLMMTRGIPAGIPVVVGSAGTSGTDSGVDWVADIVETIAREEGLSIRLARIYSGLSKDDVRGRHAARRIDALAPSDPINDAFIDRCDHIVGMLFSRAVHRGDRRTRQRDHRRPATDTVAGALRRGCAPDRPGTRPSPPSSADLCTSNPPAGRPDRGDGRLRIHRRAVENHRFGPGGLTAGA